MKENVSDKDESIKVMNRIKTEEKTIKEIQGSRRAVEKARTAVQPKSGDLHSQAMGFWLLGR